MRYPSDELRERARRAVLICPDCAGCVSVHWSKLRGGRWVADFWHQASCPTQRTARSRRAAERDLADALGALLHLADYCADGELIAARHKLVKVP